MARIGWVDLDGDDLAADWSDAPVDAEVLATYLRAAYDQCVTYLPHRREVGGLYGDLVPIMPMPGGDREASCRLAQIMQARALYNSVTAGRGDQLGPDGLAVTVYPMDWTVRNLLRPRRVGRVL